MNEGTKKLNKMALAGLILGLTTIFLAFISLSWAGLFAIFPLIFSIIAIIQTKKRKEKGKILAFIGLASGVVFFAIYLWFIISLF